MPQSPEEAVSAISDMNWKISQFWVKSHGWAPKECAELLSKSRLDWQFQLSCTLAQWVEPPHKDISDAHLILGWANLGALVEGTLKWFLAVYYHTYKNDADAIKDHKGIVQAPDEAKFDRLRHFFKLRVWCKGDTWDDWILRIQQRRNAIHAFKDRDLGSHVEFLSDVVLYYGMLSQLHTRAPLPEDY